MKTPGINTSIMLLFLIIVGQIETVYSQTEIFNKCTQFDTINVDCLKINGITFGDSVRFLQTNLGVADSIKTDYNETDEENVIIYYYGDSYYEIANGHISGFDIGIAGYCLNELSICVGDNIESLKNVFPQSFEIWKQKKDSFKLKVGEADLYLVLGISQNVIINFSLWKP